MQRIGFLSSSSASGVSRDFSPSFFTDLFRGSAATLVLDRSYGASYGYDYRSCLTDGIVELASRQEVLLSSESVFSLLSPSLEELRLLNNTQTLISFLHFSTHPDRIAVLSDSGCRAIAIDSIVDRDGERIVEDFRRVARSAMASAFTELRHRVSASWWFNPARGPIVVYIFGAGAVAAEVAKQSARMGSTGFVPELLARNGNPEVEIVLTNSVHHARPHFRRFVNRKTFSQAGFPHLVVDAARRLDTKTPLLAKEDYKMLPPEALLVDVSADGYSGDAVVKGFSGIPSGDDRQSLFEVDDPAWITEVPNDARLDLSSRRVALSHYSWCSKGSLDEKRANTDHYGEQLLPILSYLFFPGDERSRAFSPISDAVSQGDLQTYLRKSETQ